MYITIFISTLFSVCLADTYFPESDVITLESIENPNSPVKMSIAVYYCVGTLILHVFLIFPYDEILDDLGIEHINSSVINILASMKAYQLFKSFI